MPDMTAAQWERVRRTLPPQPRFGRPRSPDRRVIDGVRWKLAQPEAQWRDVPARYGAWVTCYRRHRTWLASGLWDRIEAAAKGDVPPPATAAGALVEQGGNQWV
jgi:transposase